MTMALCFNCGHTKFGAICPCPECHVASSGDMGLDIAFSDHHLPVPTLEAFGDVIRAIRRVCEEDDALRMGSFLRYVSTRHPEILTIDQPPEQQVKCDDVLARADPPPVAMPPPREKRIPPPPPRGSALPKRRSWWRFWRS